MRAAKTAPEDVLSEDQVLREALGIPRGDFRFGTKVSIFNQEMCARREERGWGQADLAKLVGVSKATITQIETFRRFPPAILAANVALALGTTAEVLFPAWLKFYLSEKSTKVFVWTIDELMEALERAALVGKPRIPPMVKPAVHDPVEEVERHLLIEAVNLVLQTISSRQRQILALRFGLQGAKPMTLAEVGRLQNVSRERVQQIQKQAMKKLKHPSSTRKLRPFL